MHRRPLLEMLACYERVYPSETAVAARIRALVESHVNCFERSCRPGHVTGAAWILSSDRRHVLLTHHRRLDRWLQLGGHADGQCDVAEVALREAREESGMRHFQLTPVAGAPLPLDVDVHEVPPQYDISGRLIEEAHEHHDIRFLMIANPGQELTVSDESRDLRWFVPEDVPTVTDEPSVLRMLHKCRPWLA